MENIDFSDATRWHLSQSATSYVTKGSGLVACIFSSKRPEKSKFGAWVKVDGIGNRDAAPLYLAWCQSLREAMLEMEVARHKFLAGKFGTAGEREGESEG